MRFKDKVAIVTGSGQGIGEIYAKRLAAEGASVVVAELKEDTGSKVAKDIEASGGKAIFVKTDVGSDESCANLASQTKEAFGGADFLLNNAAIFHGYRVEPMTTIDRDYYLNFFNVNMHSILWVTRAIAPLMIERGGGVVVNQSSTAAYLSSGVGDYYGIAKLGVNGLTMSLSAELGPKNIRVNGIAPGPTDTEALHMVGKEIIDSIVESLPLKRLGSPDDMADAVMWLLSDEAKWVTGQTICVDGGMIRRP